jgi:hypothetical protein
VRCGGCGYRGGRSGGMVSGARETGKRDSFIGQNR